MSHRLHDLAGAEAAGADPDGSGSTLYICPDAMDVGVLMMMRELVGMTYEMAKLGAFSADITATCLHDDRTSARFYNIS